MALCQYTVYFLQDTCYNLQYLCLLICCSFPFSSIRHHPCCSWLHFRRLLSIHLSMNEQMHGVNKGRCGEVRDSQVAPCRLEYRVRSQTRGGPIPDLRRGKGGGWLTGLQFQL